MKKSGKVVSLNVESRKKKPPKTGTFEIHSVVLDDGTSVEVGYRQTYMVGDYFDRTVETKYGKLVDAGPARPGDTEMTPTATAAAPSRSPTSLSGGGGGRTFPVQMDSPEMSIIRQNALTNAREAVIGSGMHSSPHTAATKEERQQQLDAMAEDIIYLAYKFADFSSGRRESKAAAELVRLNPPGA